MSSVCCCALGLCGEAEDDPQQEALLQPEQAVNLHANTAAAQQAQTPTRISLDTGFMARQPQQNVQQAPVTVPVSAPAETVATNLSVLLSASRLLHYEDALRELGCTHPEDLHDLEEADLVEVGMKKIEMKRLQRAVAES